MRMRELMKSISTDQPQEGKVYRLTGAHGVPCIGGGSTWAESIVKEETRGEKIKN